LTLWQCAAKVILAFLIFAVLVLQVHDCRPYTLFKLLSFFSINHYHHQSSLVPRSSANMKTCRLQSVVRRHLGTPSTSFINSAHLVEWTLWHWPKSATTLFGIALNHNNYHKQLNIAFIILCVYVR